MARGRPIAERELPFLTSMRGTWGMRTRRFLPAVLAFAAAASVAQAQGAPGGGVTPAVRAVGTGDKPAVTPAQKRRTPTKARAPRRTPVRTARAAKPSAAWASPRSAGALATNLAATLHAHTRDGHWGVLVLSITRGDTLYSEGADLLLKPASTMKLMTTALALERLGPQHTFTTEVLSDRPVDAGVVAGNLYLRGGGDPTFSLRFWDGESPTDDLARQIAAAGIRQIRGDIVADESAFAGDRIPVGWKSSYLMSSYAAPISALSLNENVMWIVTRAEGGKAVVELDPASSAIPITSSVRVVGGAGGRISAHRSGDGVVVSGTIGSRSRPRRYSLVVEDPPLYAGGALEASLRAAGVAVAGRVREGTAPAGAVRVAQVRSLPLANIVSYMNRESINHFAELLFRDAGKPDSGPASAATGQEALRDFLVAKAHARREDIRVSDGSGLSEADSITARTMVQLLAYAHHAPWGSVFHASMPVAGESELLRRRMRSTPAQGNLHAKTGTTNTVSSLAGYVTALNGEVLAFAFIYNGRDRWNAKATMDRMGPTLANFYRD